MHDMELYEDRLDHQMEQEDFVLAVVTATKPDFYKQAPLVPAAEERDIPCFVINTGQHYDELLGHGLKEYGIKDRIGADLNIRGGLSQKTAEMMQKVKKLASHLDDNHPDTSVLPIVHGDTLAAGVFPMAWMFATNRKVAHNEAGLRGMKPQYDDYADEQSFIQEQWEQDWQIDRSEPFPEQFDTFVGSAASIYHLAPHDINREHLVREGYPEQVRHEEQIEFTGTIPVVGNSVIDAIDMKQDADLDRSIFDIHPVLEERDEWIRVDIHRRANLLPGRFRAIVQAVINLVEAGHNVNFIEMTATREALKEYGLRSKLERLEEKHDNFLFTGLWKKHAHVYEFLTSGQCFAELTDSGSMQEELNHIEEAHCLTARFNTDRPETVFEAHTNILVPPISGEHMHGMVEHVKDSQELRKRMREGTKVYGSNVSDKIVEFLETKQRNTHFDWSHERAGFNTGHDHDFDYL
ncbi:MAG: UDP-N-acetylglucosamine 2-epimerase [Candidatus Nanohaloarchaea archaeon]|nr:UDP-N-acetylglucosamine 2-epimerase [Candidatus Nanohaloarchaea archaeon]